jgi:hypothetical protein
MGCKRQPSAIGFGFTGGRSAKIQVSAAYQHAGGLASWRDQLQDTDGPEQETADEHDQRVNRPGLARVSNQSGAVANSVDASLAASWKRRTRHIQVLPVRAVLVCFRF